MAAALTLSLGVGALTAAFAAVDGVLLRELPMRAQDELVVAWYRIPERGSLEIPLRPADYDVVARDVASLSAVAGYPAWGGGTPSVIEAEGGSQVLGASLVAGDFFGVLGARPALGRLLEPADDALGAAPVAVLSHAAWVGRFGTDPGVIGARLRVREGPTYTLVGVAPEGLDFPRGTDFWATLRGAFPGWAAEEPIWEMHVVGRLAPGAGPATVAADMTSAFRERASPFADRQPVVTPLEDHLLGSARPVLRAAAAAALLLLLAAIANATLLLLTDVRGASHEVAVRRALGAERARLVGRLVADAVVVGVLGLAGGLGLAWLTLRGLLPMAPPELARLEGVGIDLRAVGFGLVVALLAVGLAGAIAGLATARADVRALLSAGGRGAVGGGGRVRRALATLQVALTVVTAAGAGLVARSVVAMHGLDPGFDASGLHVVSLKVPYGWMDVPEAYLTALARVAEDLEGQAGILAARPTLGGPLEQRLEVALTAEGQAPEQAEGNPYVAVDAVLPGHLEALGIPLLSGRGITEADDRPDADPVVVVDEALARALWPGADPIGRRLVGAPGHPGVAFTVVGVAGATRFREYLELHPRAYFPLRRVGHWPPAALLVRTAPGGPASVRAAVEDAFARADPRVGVLGEARLLDALRRPVARPRFAAGILLAFAAVTLLLAALGVYGTFTVHVHERTRELGVRLALGARRAGIVRLVLSGILRLAAVGAGVGLLAALWAGRLVDALLFEVTSSDPWTLGGVVVGSLAVALGAGLAPALRASSTDPAVSLRGE